MSCARFVSTPLTPAPILRAHLSHLLRACKPPASHPWPSVSSVANLLLPLAAIRAPLPRKLQNGVVQNPAAAGARTALEGVPAAFPGGPSRHFEPRLQNEPNSLAAPAPSAAYSSGHSEFISHRPSLLDSLPPFWQLATVHWQLPRQNEPNSAATLMQTSSSNCTLPRKLVLNPSRPLARERLRVLRALRYIPYPPKVQNKPNSRTTPACPTAYSIASSPVHRSAFRICDALALCIHRLPRPSPLARPLSYKIDTACAQLYILPSNTWTKCGVQV